MNPYLEKLKAEYAQELPVSLFLYRCFQEKYPTDSAAIRQQFSELNDVLKPLSLQDCDRVWDLSCRLCCEYEQEGFLQGLRLGALLTMELLQK